ncbi:hypothetical protein HKX48_001550 [Thoreauomyces humboldtii]|nr:hypothetical protein HKX48_001550 [Thoreauomyces humboldtii]
MGNHASLQADSDLPAPVTHSEDQQRETRFNRLLASRKVSRKHDRKEVSFEEQERKRQAFYHHPKEAMISAASLYTKAMPGAKNVPFARIWRAAAAEFFGTLFFVFAVGASVAVPANLGLASEAAAGLLITAILQGFTIAAMISATGPISGGHLNPAVTLSLVVTRCMRLRTGLFYVAGQVVGAICGSALFLMCTGRQYAGTLGATIPSTTAGRTFATEFMITSILIFTVLGTAVHSGVDGTVKALAPIPIGFAVLIGVLIGGTITGGSMNPARSFGPAVVSGNWYNHELYWFAPLLGAAVVGVVYKGIFLSAPVTRRQAELAGMPMAGDSTTTIQRTGTGVSEADLIAWKAVDEGLLEVVVTSTGNAVGPANPLRVPDEISVGDGITEHRIVGNT